MTDSVAIFDPGFRVLDAQGNPVSGAQIRFFDAGTSNPRAVFSDSDLLVSLGPIVYTRSDGYPVASSGSSTTVTVFTGVGKYKVDILDQFGATIYPAKDQQQGAVATTNLGTPEVEIPVSIQTGAAAIDATYNSRLFVGNTSGSDITATLALAAVLGDGFNVEFLKSAQTNRLIITTTGGNTINGQFSITLNDQYDFIALGCDGSNFYIRSSRIKASTRQVGEIRFASVAGARTGELECNGAAISRSTFFQLFAVLGTQHGSGDGLTTFNLPNYQGRFLRFWDHAGGVDPNSGARTAPNAGGNTGDNPGTHQGDDYLSHRHFTVANAAAPLDSAQVGSGNQAAISATYTGTAFNYTIAGTATLADTARSSLSPTSGGAETRGKNVYVAAYIQASLPI